jgi:3'-phosphoadenosine 5'-phosphosulfate sulfotransferase (PAPS reductase)/FAD synthetase
MNNARPGLASGAYLEAWREAVSRIAHSCIKGLQLSCPACGRQGTLVSQWAPRTPVKPLYIAHPNGGDEVEFCSLQGEAACQARASLRFTVRDAAKTLRWGRAFALFSGGQDSLCLLDYMRVLTRRARRDLTAIHADTTAGFPEVEDYVKGVCAKLRVALVVVRPPQDYFDLAKRWGIPGVASRWCCETLKIAPIRRYLASVPGPKVVYDGIRAAESNVRGTYVPIWFHPAFRCICVSPIFYWSDARVQRHRRCRRLPAVPGATLGTSAECWCGAYKCQADFEALLEVHPEIYDKLVQVEKAQRGAFTFLYHDGKRVPLASLRNEILAKSQPGCG